MHMGGGGMRMGGGGGFSGARWAGRQFRRSPRRWRQLRSGPPVGGPGFSGARVAGGGNWNGGELAWRYFRHGRFFPGFAAGAIAGAALGSYAYYDDPYSYGD